MTKSELKEKASLLTKGVDNPEKVLQDILADFLKGFHIEACGWVINPTEVEAYCHCACHPDGHVHQNDLQKGRFGHLYVHRHPNNPQNNKGKSTPKGWAGIDVCLSDDDSMYFGILIRSAEVYGHGKSLSVYGPYSLYKALKEGQSADYYLQLEAENALFEGGLTKKYVFYSRRIGLKEEKNPVHYKELLRAVIADKLAGTEFKMKEELFYGLKNIGEERKIIALEVIGYVPGSLK